MEQVVQALSGLLLKALPTFFLVLFLYIFLKKVFFDPLERVMRNRYEATEGAMNAAREGVAAAEAKTAEYQQALRDARAEMYRQQEQERQRVLQEIAQQVQRARAEAEARINAARQELRADTDAARESLRQQSGVLADSIADSVLQTEAGSAR